MSADDILPIESGRPVPRRVAELEAENAALQDSLANAERRAAVLLQALQHEGRNLLAVIRSIARRSARPGGTADDYAMHLDGRLGAIARAMTLLLRDPARGVSLNDVFAEELLAHAAHEGERVSLSGPEVRLRGKAAQTIWLVVHELATNAVKFGALAVPSGHLAVSWHTEPQSPRAGQDDAILRLEWLETGTVPLDALQHGGFGTEVIERTLAYELGGSGALCFAPDGLRCTLVLPLTDQVTLP